jgi:hypothetical protein
LAAKTLKYPVALAAPLIEFPTKRIATAIPAANGAGARHSAKWKDLTAIAASIGASITNAVGEAHLAGADAIHPITVVVAGMVVADVPAAARVSPIGPAMMIAEMVGVIGHLPETTIAATAGVMAEPLLIMAAATTAEEMADVKVAERSVAAH